MEADFSDHLKADFDQQLEADFLQVAMVAGLSFWSHFEVAFFHDLQLETGQFLEAAFEQQFEADWQLEVEYLAEELGPVAITAETAAGEIEQIDHLEAEGSPVLWLCSACSELCLLQIQVLPTLWQWQSTGSFGSGASMQGSWSCVCGWLW